MQTIIITGRVGGDAETRVAGTTNVTDFNCAVGQFDKGEKTTNWFRVAIWGDRGGKLEQYIKKGDKVAVTGELSIGEYNGKPQYEIRAADVDCFFGGKRDDAAPKQPARSAAPVNAAFDADLDDDVPF